MVVVIIVDAYPFLAFSYLTCHLEDTGIGVFWLHCGGGGEDSACEKQVRTTLRFVLWD